MQDFFYSAIFWYLYSFTHSVGEKAFEVKVTQEDGGRARIYTQVLDLQDGSYVARFRPFETYSSLRINVGHNEKHVGKSPYYLRGTFNNGPRVNRVVHGIVIIWVIYYPRGSKPINQPC